ncbi:helix-turn-helix domain-containing protein [Nonomuraea cavernae]|uniref:HTH cro/C1-type domain-containing protein n=1 Tax=Nonomuraea cavernae TaxID=2045107 RepID=A0A918DG55_9ACTN|nr:helix-turn-helix transcriptional regulator [Nonomuraea cavernae]MCA2184308.1 helix-turn-helix domain-containing protein [Nonomuraea cavernae]GGO64195.1 hypothetical protein GCM10012289_13050 [Nonomuraea cavernae]
MVDSGRALARRLRSLRDRQWPDTRVTQPQLARALDVSVPLISSWESPNAPKVPPVNRLEAYATLFCTIRSLRDGSLAPLPDDELDPDELRTREDLRQELLALRAAALGQVVSDPETVRNPWDFGDDKPVTLVCARLPQELLDRMPYVKPHDPDYIELYTYADLDALFELHGHIRAFNPSSEVRRHTPNELVPDDLTTHLVLLGGVDWNDLTADVIHHLGLPVRQINDWDGSAGPYFEAGSERHHPRLRDDGVLLEDVALFYRGPNPLNRKRTLTICNGMYGRGTLGAVRTLTDSRFRDRNAAYVNDRFGDSESFAILTRVSILNGLVMTPDWTQEESRLHEWPGHP